MNNNQHLALSLEKVQSLKTLLEDEFSALKAKDLGRFESYQASKADILSFLAQQDLSPSSEDLGGPGLVKGNVLMLDQVLNILDECKTLHRRNEIFINRKLDSIRNALSTIQSSSSAASVDVYDRLGKIRSRRRQQTMGDA